MTSVDDNIIANICTHVVLVITKRLSVRLIIVGTAGASGSVRNGFKIEIHGFKHSLHTDIEDG